MEISWSFKRLLAWRSYTMWVWGESLVIVLLTLWLCYVVNPTNPLFLKEIFPWPWIASIIVVFQYGMGPSILTFLAIACVAVTQRNAGAMTLTEFQSYLISGGVLILISTLFISGWVRKTLNADVLQSYTEERLKSLSRSYFMLRLSSDYLEQNIISKPMTLRLAFQALKELNLNEEAELLPETAYSFLQIVSQFCQVNVVGIYLYKNKQLNPHPFVEIGLMGSLNLKDPLIAKATEIEQITYVSVNEVDDPSECKYLVACPLIPSDNKPIGLLVIKEMPFWSLNDETLRVLSILIYYFIKEVYIAANIAKFLVQHPSCPVDFAKQLTKLIPLKSDMGLDSALVVILVGKELRPQNVIYNLKTQQRLLDSFWFVDMEKRDALITLMPFTSAAGIYGYITRIKNYLSSSLGLSLQQDGIQTRSMQITGNNAQEVMDNFFKYIKESDIV